MWLSVYRSSRKVMQDPCRALILVGFSTALRCLRFWGKFVTNRLIKTALQKRGKYFEIV